MGEQRISDILPVINKVNVVFNEYFIDKPLDEYSMIEFIQKFDSYKERLVATACMLMTTFDPVRKCHDMDSTNRIIETYYKLKKYNKKHKIRLFIDVKLYCDSKGYLDEILYRPTLKPSNYKKVVQSKEITACTEIFN